MNNLKKISSKVLNNDLITKEDAYYLLDVQLDKLCYEADNIRKHFCSNNFDACTIINVKNGRCSEDCIFCSQSTHYNTNINEYPLLNKEELLKQSYDVINLGFNRISYVASGRRVSDDEFQILTKTIKELENTDVKICVSLGLLSQEQIVKLKKSCVDRIHNNLESSPDYFKRICSTHSFDEKINTLKKVQKEDVLVCSGGIFGLGESFKDRIDLAFKLRQFNIKSIPINILHPIKGTPVEKNRILTNDEVCRTVAIFRFINPDSYIRMAGGRLLLEDNGRRVFQSGANASILGNMLNTDGVNIEDDIKMITDLGFKITYNIE